VRLLNSVLVLAFAPIAGAQTARPAPLTPAQQIASAVLPLPTEYRDSATVLGYRSDSPKLVTLRQGTGGGSFTCLASDPSAARFHVACYHHSLEPFMARGRALRAQGITGEKVDTVRFAEVKAGKIAMPAQPAALYSLTGPVGSYDPATNAITGARPLVVIYIPGATAASTGLSAKPQEGAPWIMFPGTPKAHIMLVPRM
jgi:hypothetical protein